jgi:GNAT superfamily N-acetyltransferase
MFLAYEFRGKGVAKLLLKTLLDWATENKIKTVYLGTMSQFKAAQKFYVNNGVTKIDQTDLPFDFPLNPVDAVFYKMTL